MSEIGIATCLDPDLEAEIIREIEQQNLPLKIVRRCRDITEILAASAAQLVDIAIIDTEIIDLDAAARQDLTQAQTTVVALAPVDDLELLTHWGGISVLAKTDPRLPEITDSDTDRILALVMQLMMPPPPPSPQAPSHPPASPQNDTPDAATVAQKSGKVVAVWGPPGSTGKSSMVVNLASFLRGYGEVLLIDADTVDSCLVQMLGISLETSGLVQACRLAQLGHLNQRNFAEVVTNVGSQVDLLSGLNKGNRWREISDKPLAAVVEWAREKYSWILVDLAPGFEDTADPLAGMGASRFAAQTAVLSVADLVLEVGLADPVGLRRLVVNHDQAVAGNLWHCPALVVVNRARAGVAGSHWDKSISQALAQFLPEIPGVCIRDASEDFDRALVAGCDIVTANPEAKVLTDFLKLTNSVLQLLGMRPRRKAGINSGRQRKSLSKRGRHSGDAEAKKPVTGKPAVEKPLPPDK